MKTEIRANSEKFEVLLGTPVSWMDIHQATTEANQREMLAKMDDKTDTKQERLEANMESHHEKFMAITKAIQEKVEAMMGAYLEKTEATDLEENPEEIKSIVEHQEVPKEDVAVKTIRALED
jgi:hypothetical protein